MPGDTGKAPDARGSENAGNRGAGVEMSGIAMNLSVLISRAFVPFEGFHS
jgi:hypothetical protein